MKDLRPKKGGAVSIGTRAAPLRKKVETPNEIDFYRVDIGLFHLPRLFHLEVPHNQGINRKNGKCPQC